MIVLLPMGMAVADPELLGALAGKPVLIARLTAPAPPPAGPQLGFAGVAKPWKVQRALRAAGCDLVDFTGMPDHAQFDEGTLKVLADRARMLGAGLVTTEKDWIRLTPAWRAQVTAWPVRARFDDEAALDALLGTTLTR